MTAWLAIALAVFRLNVLSLNLTCIGIVFTFRSSHTGQVYVGILTINLLLYKCTGGDLLMCNIK